MLVLVYYIVILEKDSLKFSGGVAMGAVNFVLCAFMLDKTMCGLNLAKMTGYYIVDNN